MKKNTAEIDEPGQDCWRRIGIWGNESSRCEKLKLVKHCRNCEVFEQAARAAMTERRIKSDGTDLTIDEQIEKELLAGNQSIMPFRIANQCIAVPCSAVLTISDKVAIHSIPYNQGDVVKGLVAINHEVYTFISMEKLLGLEIRKSSVSDEKLHSLFNRTLVVDFSGRVVVFYVDEVYQIHRYFDEDIEASRTASFNAKFSQSMIKNEYDWCGDCHLLNLDSTSDQLAVSGK